jgi:hypothetical protein
MIAQTERGGTTMDTRGVIVTNSAFSKDQIEAINRLLEGATPQRILRRAVAEFHPRLTMWRRLSGRRGVA